MYRGGPLTGRGDLRGPRGDPVMVRRNYLEYPVEILFLFEPQSEKKGGI